MQRFYRVFLISLMLYSLTMQSQAGSNDGAFILGWKVGQVDMHEAQILEAFLTIQFLEDEEGERIGKIVSTKRRQINVDLVALAMYSEEIDQTTHWPDEVRAVILIKSSNVQPAMHRLRQSRHIDGWEDSDSENERAIQRVFDKYEKFGNILGIESN